MKYNLSFLIVLCIFLCITACSDEDDINDNLNLEKPILTQPANGALYGANQQTLLFDWNDVNNAVRYSIEITDPFTLNTIFTSDATNSEIEISREDFYNYSDVKIVDLTYFFNVPHSVLE